MSPPYPTPSGKPTSGGVGQVVLVAVVVLGCMALVCCGGLAVLGALFYSRAETSIAEVRQSIQESVQNPSIPKWEDDWVAMHALTAVYTAMVDASVQDPRVIERLGEPVEISDTESALFRRERSGGLAAEETFEFDLKGPKGTATVKVDSTASTTAGHRPVKAVVLFMDETEIELAVPTVVQR